uniref:Movement protein n=1 Tax=Xerochrysum ophiovirus_brac TaxID=2983962 RepID=A0A9N7ABG6_9VIRU|nr:TPA_asm: movement protein [Xerochrysum ophiovirus_brac]
MESANSGIRLLRRSTTLPTELHRSETRISLERAISETFPAGEGTIISLSGDEPLNPEVQCMAAEFSKMTRGRINSAFSPIELNLKGKTGEASFTVSSFAQVWSGLKKIIKVADKPYMRLSKVQILYCPLFDQRKNKGEMITFSLVDERMKGSKENRVIASITAAINEMSMSEMNMSFFVPKDDIKKIKLITTVDNEPTKFGSFASLMIGFYVHSSYFPGTYEVERSKVFYIDPTSHPKTIKSGSVLRNIGKKLERASLLTEKKLDRLERAEEILTDGLLENVAERNSDIPRRNSTSLISEIKEESVEELIPHCVINLEEWSKKTYSSDIGYILDTGAPSHFIHLKGHSGKTKIGGMWVTEINSLVLDLCGEMVELNHVFVGNNVNPNLISYSQLKKQGIIDRMIDEGDTIHLMKGDLIKFVIDNTSDGRMWFMVQSASGEFIRG